MDTDVKNVSQASEAVGKFEPPVVRLSDGTDVTVKKLGWKGFKKMFASLSQIVQLWLENNNAQEKATEVAMGGLVIKNQLDTDEAIDDGAVTKAEANAKAAFKALAEGIMDAPDIVEKLVETCTGIKPEAQDDLEFDDMIDLAKTAIDINFLKNKKVLGFLEGWTSAVSDSPKEKEKQPEKAVVDE